MDRVGMKGMAKKERIEALSDFMGELQEVPIY